MRESAEMTRTVIDLIPEVRAALKHDAVDRNVSVSFLINESMAEKYRL
jgi:hypothetical protein